MQRTSFDVNSIAALLRQTEANLAALKPRQEAQRYSGEPIFSSTLPYTSSAPVRSQLGSGVELETQVVQLRTCIETLERRLEEELRSFLAISDKRLQAREEQLRGIGETLQASADAAMEQLNRRVDTRLHDLERAGLAPSALDEIWEALKRLEGDCQDLDGKLRRAASADDLADRFKEVERAQVQRFDERLATQEKRMSDMRLQLQTANEEFLQAINRRCEVLEKIVWEGQTDKGDIETVFKRLAEAAPIREMQEEINACNYEKEVQRTRLTTLEAKLSKQAALESKVDFMESQTSQQLEEQAQKFRHVSELQHKLSQKLASTEAASQRVEAQGASLQAKLQSQLDEERERMHSSFDALQQRVTKQLEEVEGRASRGSKRSEQDLVEHVNALTQKLMEESIAAQKQAEKRLHTVDERSDQVIQAARSQMEKAIQDLKMDAEVAKNAMDADLQRMDRFVQEIGSKMSTQEGQLVRLSDMDIQRSRIEAMESKLNEVQGEQRLLRDLKSIMDAHKLQADRRLGDLDSALASIEEQIREKDRRRNNDVDAHRARFEGFENRLTELQVSQVRHKTSVENLDIAVTSLEPLRATVTTLQGGLAAVEEQIRSRAQELSQDMQQSWNSQNSLTQRVNAPHASSQASQGPKPGFDKPRRQRVTGKPATARASARSKDDEIQKVFNDIDTGGSGVLTLEDLQSYLCDHLGFGQAEAFGFMKTFGQGDGVSMEGFKKGYARLTPFLLSKRQNEVLIRKDGSLSSMGPQSLQIEELDDCEVYICEVTNTIFVDECKRCAMLIGPCETSVFVRDCEDCVFWIAAQQLRTRGCKRCKFFLYSKTEPVIEASQDLAFAPWSASYPCAKAHFKQFGFNPDVNLWNAIFDFSGKTGTSNWRILGLEEVFHIEVELEEPPPNPSPEDPAAPVTYEVLCAPPLQSGESCGQSVGSIPQTRPALPAAPPSTFSEVKQVPVQDGAKLSVFEQLKQSQSLKAAASGSSPESTGGLAMAALAGKTFMEVAGGSVLQNPKEEIKSDTGVSALGMASLAGQALMEAGTSGTMDVDDEDSSGETPRIKQLAPPASVTTLSGAHAKPKAAVTPAEVAGGSVLQNPKEEIKSDTGVSALGMASLAGQALMEAGTSGTMDVDDEDSSGETPRIKQLAPPASVTTLSGAHAKPKAVVTPAEVKKQLQKQLGESSDEEEELPQAKPKSMALPKARIARQIGDSEDDEDSDIERAMKKAAAEAARSRQAPGASGAGSSKTPLNTFATASSSVQSEQKGLAASDSDDDNFFDDDEARSRQAPGASGAGSSKTPLNTFAPASSSVQSEQKGLAASDSDDDNFFDDDEELPM